MNNEFSFESIFNAGVGNKPVAKVEPMSVERFDGSFDNIFAEVARSEEELDFIEKFGAVSEMNSVNKMKMLAKLKKTYGSCNRGLESFIQSCEADEVDGTSAKKDESKSDDKAIEQPKGTDQKKENWAKTALKAVVTFFKKIWEAIVSLVKSIVSAISNKFNESKLNSMAKKDGASASIKFAKQVQDGLKKMDPLVKKLSSAADSLLKESFKDDKSAKGDPTNKKSSWGDKVTAMSKADGLQAISASMKLLTTVEKVIYKSFTKFRAGVVKGTIKTNGSGKFDQFVSSFNTAASTLFNAVNSIKIGKVSGREFTYISEETQKMIKDYAGIDVKMTPSRGGIDGEKSYREYVKCINAYISDVNAKLTEEKTFETIGKTLFGIEEDKSAKTEEKK